jgi:hypothetical protein
MAPSDAELKAIFASFDADGSGRIDLDELTAALAKGGKKMSRSEVENIVKLVDKNNDGEVSARWNSLRPPPGGGRHSYLHEPPFDHADRL